MTDDLPASTARFPRHHAESGVPGPHDGRASRLRAPNAELGNRPRHLHVRQRARTYRQNTARGRMLWPPSSAQPPPPPPRPLGRRAVLTNSDNAAARIVVDGIVDAPVTVITLALGPGSASISANAPRSRDARRVPHPSPEPNQGPMIGQMISDSLSVASGTASGHPLGVCVVASPD